MAVKSQAILIRVLDRDYHFVRDPEVSVEYGGDRTVLPYDADAQGYFCNNAYAGVAVLQVSCPGYETQRRPLRTVDAGTEMPFYLGVPGASYTTIAGSLYPYTSTPNQIVVFGRFSRQEQALELETLLRNNTYEYRSEHLAQIGVVQDDGMVYSRPYITLTKWYSDGSGQAAIDLWDDPGLRSLRGAGYLAGPIFIENAKGLRVFTNIIDILPAPGVSIESLNTLLTVHDLAPGDVGAGGYRQYYTPLGVGEGITSIVHELMAMEVIQKATVISSGMNYTTAINEPGDFLWGMLWDRKIIGVMKAWDQLNDVSSIVKYGDPNIVIAVIDDGIKSNNGVVENEDFKGSTSNAVSATVRLAVNRPTITIYGKYVNAVSVNDLIAFKDGHEEEELVVRASIAAPGRPGILQITVDSPQTGYDSGYVFQKGGAFLGILADSAVPGESRIPITELTPGDIDKFKPGQSVRIAGGVPSAQEDVRVLRIDKANPADLAVITTPIRRSYPQNSTLTVGIKVYKLYDFDKTDPAHRAGPDNDDVIKDWKTNRDSHHGIACAGIAAANADNAKDGQAFGVVGVAPNARLMGVMMPDASPPNDRDVMCWIAGLSGLKTHGPGVITPGADVLSLSLSIENTNGTMDIVLEMAKRIVRRGRGGRGTVVIMSAGNEKEAIGDNEWISAPEFNAVAATSKTFDAGTHRAFESRVEYSNYDGSNGIRNKAITFAAPGGDATGIDHCPPISHRIITADFVGKGDLPGHGLTQNRSLLTSTIAASNKVAGLIVDIRQGDPLIVVNDNTKFANNDWIRIGEIGDANIEWAQIQTVRPDKRTIDLTATLSHDHIARNKTEAITTTVLTAISTTEFVADTPYSGTDDAKSLRKGGVVRVTVGGVDTWRKVSEMGSDGGKCRITVDVAFPTAPAPGNTVHFPAIKNFGTQVVGTTVIEVQDTSPFNENEWVLVGKPATTQCQAVYIHKKITGSTTDMRVSALMDEVVDDGTKYVYRGPNDYFDRFNGTSAAAPVASGTAALVLSAKPSLTWLEVRDIMMSTAAKIDLGLAPLHDKNSLSAVDIRWYDLEGRPLTGGYNRFTLNSFSSPLITGVPGGYTVNPGSSVVQVDIFNAAFKVGSAVEIRSTAAAIGERGVITGIDSTPTVKALYLDRSVTNTYTGASVRVVTGSTTVKNAAGVNSPNLIVNSANSFVVGQEIIIETAGQPDEYCVIKDIPAQDEFTLEKPLSRAVNAADNVKGGLANRFVRRSAESDVVGSGNAAQGTDFAKVTASDIWQFEKGHAVTIAGIGDAGRQRLIVDHTEIATSKVYFTTNLSAGHGSGTDVITGFTELSSAVTEGSTSLPVDDSDSFVVGQAIEIESPAPIYTVITAIPNQTTLVVYPPLWHDVSSGKDIYGGRIPHRSAGLGSGRVDAGAAVEKALAYSHSMRDLMIRSFAGDTGIASINRADQALLSPDIWIRHQTPTTDADKYPVHYDDGASDIGRDTESYNDSINGIHEQVMPLTDDSYIYARIKNRGNLLEGLESKVRFHLYRSRNTPDHIFATWDDTRRIDDAAERRNTYGSFLLDEVPLYRQADPDGKLGDAMHATRGSIGALGIKAGRHVVVRAKWDHTEYITRTAGDDEHYRSFIIVEITPYDGALAGDRVGENNNVALREISFAEVDVNFGPGVARRVTGKKSRNASPRTSFEVTIEDKVGYFRMKETEVVITRSADTTEIVKVVWNGITWTYAQKNGETWTPLAQAPAWLEMETGFKKPNSGGGAPIAAEPGLEFEHTHVFIKGQVDGKLTNSPNPSVTYKFEVNLWSAVDPGQKSYIILSKAADLAVEPGSQGYNDLKLPGRVPPLLHGFGDMARFEQTEESAFGPQSSDLFRLTSGFTVKSGVPACLYAATTGFVFVQRMRDGSGFDDDLVNVIIKPLYQSAATITPVKYFVYRGLRVTDFFSEDYTRVRERTGASEFIEALYTQHEARRTAIDNGTNPGATSIEVDAVPSSAVLGWDPGRTDGEALDDFFKSWSRTGVGVIQLPLVRMGTCIGWLEEDAEFGMEVVLDDGAFTPTLAFARSSTWEVNLEDAGLTGLALRHAREQVLHFMDPAAYLGIHRDVGVYTRAALGTRQLKKGDAHYTEFLTPFTTANTLYLDVRSENGLSMNFYENYSTTETLRIGGTRADLVSRAYTTYDWPIKAITRTAGEIENADTGNLFLSLPTVGDPVGNTKGGVFIEHGKAVTDTIARRFVTDGLLRVPEEPWTREIGFNVDQVTVGDAPRDVATYLRLHYGRGVVSTGWDNPVPVPVLARHTDNLFGPIDYPTPWSAGSEVATRWMSLGSLKFVDGTDTELSLSFGTMVERGIAIQDGQVVFFNMAIEYFKTNVTTSAALPAGDGVDGGMSPQPNLLTASTLFGKLTVEMVKVTDTIAGQSIEVNTVRLVSNDPNAVSEGVMMLGLSEANATTLRGLMTQLSDKHPRNIVLMADEMDLPGGSVPYHRYTAHLRGLDGTTLKSKDVSPVSPIYVYTRDGLTYVPSGFTMPNLVPQEYTPTPEEQRAMERPEVDAIIAADSAIAGAVSGFEQDVEQVAAGSTNAYADLQTAINTHGPAVLAAARSASLDLALYYARLRMLVTLKSNDYVRANPTDRDTLERKLEEVTRGYTGLSFPNNGSRKVIVVAFDPLDFDDVTGLPFSNPAAVMALGLHGQSLACNTYHGKTGHVQSMILPLRYKDYDEGLVERVLGEYLEQNSVHMIVSVNQNGASGSFFIERFAALDRSDISDNNDARSMTPVGSGIGSNSYYQTSTVFTDMMQGINPPQSNQEIFFNQSFEGIDDNGDPISRLEPSTIPGGGPNSDVADPTLNMEDVVTISVGSAGNFIPNEVFYRIARARMNRTGGESSVRTSHLSIPAPQYTGGSHTMQTIATKAGEIICKGLKNL